MLYEVPTQNILYVCAGVLILVLVEDALRDRKGKRKGDCKRKGLNPCFSGRCSTRAQKASIEYRITGLNPCFSGRCSTRLKSVKHYQTALPS